MQDAQQYFGGPADLIMIFCKGMQTDEMIRRSLPLIDEETCVLTLQNGIGNPEIIGKYMEVKSNTCSRRKLMRYIFDYM